MILIDEIAAQARRAALELCEAAALVSGQIVIVGCSSSEIAGLHIGRGSSADIGAAVFAAINGVLAEREVYLAAQCCEHLNRAVIIEREAVGGRDIVSVVPRPEAGGAFAAAAYKAMLDPVAVEEIYADAGLDIGGTLIGMHLKKVAVPVRLETRAVGEAQIIAARTRPRLIGGVRAVYDERLL